MATDTRHQITKEFGPEQIVAEHEIRYKNLIDDIKSYLEVFRIEDGCKGRAKNELIDKIKSL